MLSERIYGYFGYFRGHRGSVESVVNVADGVIASTGFDKSIKIWRDLDQLPDEVDEIKAKKRAKREDRGEVKTSGKNLKKNSQFLLIKCH